MTAEDPELEVFLRQFRPVAPPPLPRPPATPVRRVGLGFAGLAAAASVVALLMTPARPPMPRGLPPARPDIAALNAALRGGRYEIALDAWADRVLPDPAREGGALRMLGDLAADR